jgi:sugar phosphate isomerase/epimerase
MTPLSRYSICQLTTPDTTFEQDLELFAAAGATGLTVCENKLRDGEDEALIAAVRASGLEAPIGIANCNSPLPAEPAFPGPREIDVRVELMSAALHRFAPFGVRDMIVTTGKRPGSTEAADADAAVEALIEVARVADGLGMRLSLEPVRNDLGLDVTIATTLPATLELMERIGAGNVNVCYDVYHLWDTPDIVALTREHAGEVGTVHVADWRSGPTRTWADRALPGEGTIDLAALFSALEAGGYDGWYDLEIFSEKQFPDSLWNLPVEEMLERATKGFTAAWRAAV